MESAVAIIALATSRRWQHKLGVGVVNTLVPLSANAVLATDADGKVAVLEAAD